MNQHAVFRKRNFYFVTRFVYNYWYNFYRCCHARMCALERGAGGWVWAQVYPLEDLVSLKLDSDFDFV